MVKCTCGKEHEEEELLKFLPNDEMFPAHEIDCVTCPICNNIVIEPDEQYPESYDEEKFMNLSDEKDYEKNN